MIEPVALRAGHWVWAGILGVFFLTACWLLPGTDTREVVGDESSHLSIALSFWNDFDVEYTLDDLARFREMFPSLDGPRSAFLKLGNDDNIYFAKPYVYGVLLGLPMKMFGVVGIHLLNLFFIWLLGLVCFRMLSPNMGYIWASVFVIGLYVISPFFAWVTIAHPDIWIASALGVGGYLLLSPSSNSVRQFIGAFLLGLIIYEKITLLPVVAALFVCGFRIISTRRLFALFVTSLVVVTALSIPHYLQDGNLSAYEGNRFLARGPAGAYPLESDWAGLSENFSPSEPFALADLLTAIKLNWSLLPMKLGDFFVGRQTGLIVYFPVVLVLLATLLSRASWKVIAIVGSVFAYMIFNWIAFPTNGYGGAGSYGSRYFMQVLPVIPIAFLFARKDRLSSRATSIGLIISLLCALAFNVNVLIPGRFDSHSLANRLGSAPVAWFPLEKTLVPTVSGIFSKGLTAEQKSNFIYDFCHGKSNLSQDLRLGRELGCSFGLFQFHSLRPFPLLSVEMPTSEITKIRPKAIRLGLFTANDEHLFVDLPEASFRGPYLDLIRGEFRYLFVKLDETQEKLLDESGRNAFKLRFTSGDLDMTSEFCNPLNNIVVTSKLRDCGFSLVGEWGRVEDWGMWTIGSDASVRLPEIRVQNAIKSIRFGVSSYTPSGSSPLQVRVEIGDSLQENWLFAPGDSYGEKIIHLSDRGIGTGRDIQIDFVVANPRSPASLDRSSDSRMLGLGLRYIEMQTELGLDL